jgi:hypothetical protein
MSQAASSPASATPPARTSDPSMLRAGTIAAFAGFALQLVAGMNHPSRIDPNQSEAVFREYASSTSWVLVHLGQLGGGLLVAFALVAIARALPRTGLSGTLALLGGVAAITWGAVFTVQMAVDGFALKATIDAWVGAAPADQGAAFLVASGVRAIEKGLSSTFHLLNGTALLTLGLAVSTSDHFPRPLGWFGFAAGIGYAAGGIDTAHTGFSVESSQILGSALVPGVVFLFGMAVAMWIRAGSGKRISVVAGQFVGAAS